MFVFHGAMETLPAADHNGRSFTQILSSVCNENGGAVDILKIEDKKCKENAIEDSQNGNMLLTTLKVDSEDTN